VLRISKKSDYAIVALSHLMETEVPVSARELAGKYGLSAQMLANVLKVLTSAGVLKSKRGVLGGYILEKKPAEIFLGEIFDIIEGPIGLSDCTDEAKSCGCEERCPAKNPMLLINQRIKSFVNNLSLEEIINQNELTFSNNKLDVTNFHYE